MQFWKRKHSLLGFFLLTGCINHAAPEVASLEIRSATLTQHGSDLHLDAAIDWRPSSAMLDALDHGIALKLRLTLVAEGTSELGWHPQLAIQERSLELRYYPLSRQYQLHDLERDEARSFTVRASLFDALEQLHLPIAFPPQLKAERYRLSAALDTTALPGALRLPALVDPNWNFRAKDYVWPGTQSG